ncbi:TPM domain-containing protein [Burkholderia pseudomallei]|uniref:TPM domain-containing protein n=1 Tax=Burkholderia pseudomallei TaxID=28450 RepID=UPI000F088778|nr:YgcG family protein [Burkholderia pseudomallei]VCJ27944.1 glycine rich membrane protein [Burkholderia pseudomallei]VCJ28974.1 glycine rich membrane protein [Burkholderia pseudomallei]
MNALAKVLLALIAAIALCLASHAGAEVAVPPLTARVTDQTGTLTAAQVGALEQTLQTFENRKGTQIAVLIVPTTGAETIEQYSLRVVEQWKLGRRQVDDGALLIVAKDDRALRIEVGYGLEGALNDAISNRIIREIIVPKFREGDFYGGITAGVDQMIRVADGEPLPPPQRRAPWGSPDLWKLAPVIFMLAVVLGGILRSAFGRLPGAVVAGGGAAFIAWLLAAGILAAVAAGLIAFLFTLMGSGMGAYVGAYGIGRRGGGFGRSGRGGFGGGGGSFGGGGASGRW